ncbi:MAG: hypothetical protein RL730_482 [Actinomycetota bacterium]|jgi:uncharacterized protein (UPF0303 family)
MTTGNFASDELLRIEQTLRLPTFDNSVAISIGELASRIGRERELPIAIEIRVGDWTVFKAALPGSKPENDGWINRKARVVNLKKRSTMYERVRAEELGIDWHKENGVVDETHAIHGGGLPLVTTDGNLRGVMVISGLPQVDDHNLGIEILRTYLNTD